MFNKDSCGLRVQERRFKLVVVNPLDRWNESLKESWQIEQNVEKHQVLKVC